MLSLQKNTSIENFVSTFASPVVTLVKAWFICRSFSEGMVSPAQAFQPMLGSGWHIAKVDLFNF
jgi:hypothetical protein